MDYKQVTIYVDKNNNLIAVAVGLMEKWGGIITEIDIVEQLIFPYESEEVERLLVSMIDKWCSLIPKEVEISPLEKFLGVKGFAKAVKGRKCIIFAWRIGEGYYVVPTKREKKGFVFLKEKKILLGETIVSEMLAAAVDQTIKDSTMI